MSLPLLLLLITPHLFIMRATSYLLPSLLLTTQIQAVPAWLSPSYSVPTTLLDPGHNKLGAVASESAICSEIGTAALQAGGNAADAMVASTLCVGGYVCPIRTGSIGSEDLD